MKPALEASPDALVTPVKNRRGRPSTATKALQEARMQGQMLVVATSDQFKAAVEKKAAEELNKPKSRLFADVGGRPRGAFKDLKRHCEALKVLVLKGGKLTKT